MRKYSVDIDNIKILDRLNSFMESCTNCKKCMKQCNMLSKFSTGPKELLNEAYQNKRIDTIVPYSCNMCGSCNKACPKGLEIDKVFMKMRKYIADKNNGISPLNGHNAVHVHQRLSFSKFFNGLIVDESSKEVKRIFMPGCSLNSYNPELVYKTYNYLKERLPGTALFLGCCGKPTESLGEEELFKKRYMSVTKILDETGADELITACQSCFSIFSKYGIKQSVKSLWTVFEEIDIPECSIGIGEKSNITFTIHDSCPTRNESQIHDSIRYIVTRLGYKFEEMKHCRDNTLCCGTGGMVLPVNSQVSYSAINMITNEINTEHVITYCASCREAMLRGNKKALHILDLIFGKSWTINDCIPKSRNSGYSWYNRFKIKYRGRCSE